MTAYRKVAFLIATLWVIGCGKVVPEKVTLDVQTPDIPKLDPLDNRGGRLAIEELDKKIKELEGQNRGLTEQLANRVPEAAAGTYKCSQNGKTCKVEYLSGSRFRFTNELGDVRDVDWDPATRTFQTGWGPAFYFPGSGQIAFAQHLTWWTK